MILRRIIYETGKSQYIVDVNPHKGNFWVKEVQEKDKDINREGTDKKERISYICKGFHK